MRTLLLAIVILMSAALCRAADTFSIGDHDFLLNGKPFQIKCGEIHFSRIPREYWSARLQMLRSMGLNTVCAYMFWNAHERSPGEYDFTGQQDVAEFVRLAQQNDLKVILRPGPYACAEWDLGGLPYWLLKDPKMQLRSRYPGFFEPARNFLGQVGKQLAPLQITHGGPIIMVQVENEYGSYGTDSQYIHDTEQAVKDAGFDVPLFNCDGWEQATRYDHGDLYVAFNFGSEVQKNFEHRAEQHRRGPNMASEFYPGWYDVWGEKHHKGSTVDLVRDIRWMLENNASFSLYMAFGGTTFGFDAGANAPSYKPVTTSYDYDAPIDEAGRPTTKYAALRELLSAHVSPGEKPTPPVPATQPAVTFPPFALREVSPLTDNLPAAVESDDPMNFESLDVPQGSVLYRTTLPAGPAAKLEFTEVNDYAIVTIAGQRVGVLDRRHEQRSIDLPARDASQPIDVLVHAFGHVNFGDRMGDRKGIAGPRLKAGEQVTPLKHWQQFKLPMSAADVTAVKFRDGESSDSTAFYRGTFHLPQAGDTYLHTRAIAGLGAVWINGHNLGRFWSIGPQQTLYVPGPWLKAGENQIIVLAFAPQKQVIVAGVNEPILDEVREAGHE